MNWWVVNLKKSNILKIGITGVLVSIIFTSGCTSSSTNETKTFSDGVMSFNYPADFYNDTKEGNETNSDLMQIISKLKNNYEFRIWVITNKTRISPTEARNIVVSKLENDNSYKILSTTTETNPNGVIVEKIIYTEDYIFGFKKRFDNMYFKINDVVYGISVYGLDSDEEEMRNIDNIIFQSIK